MKHLGDITKVDWSQVAIPDCIVGGSPCQDLSTAGLRKGLSGSRSGLFYEQIRCIRELRNGRLQTDDNRRFIGDARFAVFENVPGALSSGKPKGEDFRIILEEFVRIADPTASIPRPEGGWHTSGCIVGDGYSLAWLVHDAQWHGVPQRRRRLCVLVDYAGYEAPWILFDPQLRRTSEYGTPIETDGYLGGQPGGLRPESCGLSGNPQPSAEEGETASPGTGSGISQTVAIEGNGYRDSHHGDGYAEGDVSFTLNTVEQHGVAYTLKIRGGAEVDSSGRKAGKGALVQKELSGTLGVSQDQTLIAFGISPLSSNSFKSNNPHSGIYEAQTSRTLDHHGGDPNCNGGGMAIVQTMTFDPTQITSPDNRSNPKENDPCGTLAESGRPPVVIEMTSTKNTIVEDGVMPTLTARMGTGGNQVNAVCIGNGQMDNMSMASVANTLDTMHDQQAVMTTDYMTSIVRRLTPTECERLQNFPDGWTSGEWIDSKGKRHREAASPRYRALGNSIALPWWRWLMRRISACYDRTATLGSLFDGIGGFPLCWSLANGPGSVLWASEIEEFPIAVTTKHFGDEDKGIEGDLWQVLAEQERKKR